MTHIAKGHGRNLVCQESLSSLFACRDLSWCAIKSTSLKWLGFINNASSIPVHAIYARRHARTHTRTHARTHNAYIPMEAKKGARKRGGRRGKRQDKDGSLSTAASVQRGKHTHTFLTSMSVWITVHCHAFLHAPCSPPPLICCHLLFALTIDNTHASLLRSLPCSLLHGLRC